MNTKSIAVIIVFAALTVVLNLSPLKIPAPYAPYLIYQVWEIPIVAAFLLYGTTVGVSITLLNTLALLALFPGALPSGPLYNCAAVLSMLLGVGLVKILAERRSWKNIAFVGILFTASGSILRTAFMALVNYEFLRYPPPIGYGLPEVAIIGSIPFIVFFNASLALYTIPLGYSLARVLRPYVKT